VPAADQHLASDDRLDADVRGALAWQDRLAGEAQRHDLATPGPVDLEFAQDSRADEQDFAPGGTRIPKWPPRVDLDRGVGNRFEERRETSLKACRGQRVAKRHCWRRRRASTRLHLFLPLQ
jgi:hypothetical protein